ncbi:MAG: cytochrome d ubiquinol oxidase subunit II [Actinomycetales bacterium]|nr:cytochrome d ubiquinol oxidase subunit II [Actinomycetales bacterium]
MDVLPTVWFIAVAALWIGYLILEGFDLGVGMHMLVSARGSAAEREGQRRVMLNTIGPVWDGNEVWLLVAGAGIFAAFPLWYASLFSALYIPLTLVLVGLIFRAVAIEYRGKHPGARWGRFWDWAIGLGSFVVAFGIGAGLALTTTGLPIDANGDRVGGPFAWLTWQAVLGGLAVVGFALVHSAAFLALKTTGPVRERMGAFVTKAAPVALLPIVAWVLLIQFTTGNVASWLLVVGAVVAIVLGYVAALRRREGRAFLGIAVFVALGAAAIFTAVYPVVLPSSLDPAFSLTVSREMAATGAAVYAGNSDYTLGVMTVVTAVALPVVLVYQVWSYWVFRKRLGAENLPAVHDIVPAVRG